MLLESYSVNWFSSFGRIPSALFSYDVRVRNTIHLGSWRSAVKAAFSSRLHRWFDEERESLFALMEYARFCPMLWQPYVPKIGNERLMRAFEAIFTRSTNRVAEFVRQRGGQTAQANQVYFKKTAYNWLAFSRQPPPCFGRTGEILPQSQLDAITFTTDAPFAALQLLLNGKIGLTY